MMIRSRCCDAISPDGAMTTMLQEVREAPRKSSNANLQRFLNESQVFISNLSALPGKVVNDLHQIAHEVRCRTAAKKWR